MEKLVRNLVTNSLQQSTESYRLVFGKILFPGEHFKSVLHFKIKFEVMTCFLNLKPDPDSQVPTLPLQRLGVAGVIFLS